MQSRNPNLNKRQTPFASATNFLSGTIVYCLILRQVDLHVKRMSQVWQNILEKLWLSWISDAFTNTDNMSELMG